MPAHGAEDQQLFQSLRRALRSDEPLDLLAIVSGFLEVTDPRSRDPFARDEQRPIWPTWWSRSSARRTPRRPRR